MSGRFDGKVAVVTGAAAGFGLAVSTRLVEEGAKVVMVDWSADQLHAAAEKLGNGAGLTPQELKNELTAAGDSERHATGLSELLAQCEIVRYAPDGMQQARDRHSEFLSKFEALTERH